MTTPLLFTPELMANVVRTESQYYGSYFQYLLQEPDLEPVRQQLEADLSVYPADRLDKTINEIKSADRKQSLAAIAEVQAYRRLKSIFPTVEIEKPLALVGGKTPDFWVDNEIAFEAFAVFDESPSQQRSIVGAINQAHSHIKVFVKLDNIPKESVKLNEITRYFSTLFQNNPDPAPQQQFFNKFSNGLIISGHMLALSTDSQVDTVMSVVETHGFDENDRNHISSIRSRLVSKLTKYKALTESGFPLVTLLYNKNHWVHREDIDQALFGDPHYDKVDGQFILGKPKNGIIRADKNTTLSAVIIKQDDINTPFRLIENPYARVPLTDELRSKINLAFDLV